MKSKHIIIIFFVFLYCCNKKKYFIGPNFFQDDFENYSQLNELLLPHDTLWSLTQITNPKNNISVDTNKFHSGKKSLKFFAAKSTENNVSKCSIIKHNMSFWDGETMRVSGWYLIEGTDKSDWLFLLDLEEQTAIGASPGIRLALVNNQLRVNYKFFEKDILQTTGSEVDFPRNQWVNIVWEVKLSQKKKGAIKLWQNGQLIINTKNNTTLPKDILYSSQGTKGMYSSIEIGITANTKDNDLTLWTDDVKFEKEN